MPDPDHEAIRDLVRGARSRDGGSARKAPATCNLFCCGMEGSTPGVGLGPRCTPAGWRRSSSTIPPNILSCAEYRQAIADAETRLERLMRHVTELASSWSMAPVVEAYQAVRGVALLTAITFVAEIGDIRRFESPRQVMAYLGLVPSERSTGGQGPARRDHQSRQRERAQGPDRGNVDIPLSSPGEPSTGAPPRRSLRDRARHRLEGSGSLVCSLPAPDGSGQAPDLGHHSHRARGWRLFFGRSDAKSSRTPPFRRSRTQHRTWRIDPVRHHRDCVAPETGALGGEPSYELCGRSLIDARWQIEAAPDEQRKCGHQPAASESAQPSS